MPTPSWSLFLNKAYVIKWSFGLPLPPSNDHVVYEWPPRRSLGPLFTYHSLHRDGLFEYVPKSHVENHSLELALEKFRISFFKTRVSYNKKFAGKRVYQVINSKALYINLTIQHVKKYIMQFSNSADTLCLKIKTFLKKM